MVEGRDGEVGYLDKDGLALAILGLGGVDGEEDGLEAGERGGERGRQAEEVERREEREERERGEAEVGVRGQQRIVEPVAGRVVAYEVVYIMMIESLKGHMITISTFGRSC